MWRATLNQIVHSIAIHAEACCQVIASTPATSASQLHRPLVAKHMLDFNPPGIAFCGNHDGTTSSSEPSKRARRQQCVYDKS